MLIQVCLRSSDKGNSKGMMLAGWWIDRLYDINEAGACLSYTPLKKINPVLLELTEDILSKNLLSNVNQEREHVTPPMKTFYEHKDRKLWYSAPEVFTRSVSKSRGTSKPSVVSWTRVYLEGSSSTFSHFILFPQIEQTEQHIHKKALNTSSLLWNQGTPLISPTHLAL
jgi:hypothetical protein